MTTTNPPGLLTAEQVKAMTKDEVLAYYKAASASLPKRETTSRSQDYADGIYFVSRRDLDFFLNDDGNPLGEELDYPDEGTAMKTESVFYEMDGDLYEQAVADAPSSTKYLIIRTGTADCLIDEDGDVSDADYYQRNEELFQLNKGELIAL